MGRDREKHKIYRRLWMRRRRASFFSGKVCVRCGASDDLELDHIDRNTKVHHCIWSWSRRRRDEELAKCQVLCYECHLAKTSLENSVLLCGRPSPCRKLTKEQVIEIFYLRRAGWTHRAIAHHLGIGHPTVVRITKGQVYKEWLEEASQQQAA